MPSHKLRVRVAACITDRSRILLVTHRKDERTYQLLPGGGVKAGETLTAALIRELLEETGFDVGVGRLILICESIAPGERHIVNVVFEASVTGGTLCPGHDERLCDAQWYDRGDVAGLDFYPDITEDVLAMWAEEFKGPVRFLGNVWREQ